MMKKHLAPAFLFLMMFVAYITMYRHVVIFHEQHHLFRFSLDYIGDLAHQKGWTAPAVAFIVQFAYYPWLGALIWSAMLTGVYCMTRSVLRRQAGWTDTLQLSALLPIWTFFTTVDVDGTLKTLLIVFVSVLAVYIVSRLLPARKTVREIPWKWLPWVAPLIMGAIFGGFYYRSFDPITINLANGQERTYSREEVKVQKANEAMMIKAAQAVRAGDWDEVVEISNAQAETGVKNHLMTYFRAMALYHRGELLDHLFDVPPSHGPTSLFFPWKAEKNRAEFGGFIYEQLGALNAATHWEFEAMVGWGETAYHLINLSRYLIESGKPLQARKFIAPLKQTLFYRDTARKLEQALEQGHIDGLHNAFANFDEANTPIRFDNVENIAADCKYLLQFDPTNEMARQYMMITFLLANNLGIFYDNLKQFYPPGEPLPRLYEEALCLVRLNYGGEQLAADGYPISPEIDAQYRAFMAEKNKKQFANFTPAQRRTYWYYVLYLSPFGNKLNF